jgi:hypothetical protein
MLNILDSKRSLRNGKDGPRVSGMALGNTAPLATRGSTFGADVAVPVAGTVPLLEISDDLYAAFEGNIEVQVVREYGRGRTFSLFARTIEGFLAPQAPGKVLRPAGQVVLFKKVMEQWGFRDKEASTLLGFEDAADMRDIYDGKKAIGQRDANDRLRAVLRIAADIDALFGDGNAIRDWLSEPQKDLDGQTPRALLNEGSMENLLRVKYYVSYLSGR